MTLKRILEPEVMDSESDAREYNAMDHSEVNRQFVSDLLEFASHCPRFSDRLREDSVPQEAGWIDTLDLGTGTALIPVELCKRRNTFRVMAIDLAAHMLDYARFNVEAESLSDRIQLAQVDAKSLTFDSEMFEVVISNSIIHHVPDPSVCLEEMVRVTADGGLIFVRDLMRPTDQTTLDSLVQTYVGSESDYSQRLFRESLHAALSLDEIREFVQGLGFDAESVKATSDRHWTWSTQLADSGEA